MSYEFDDLAGNPFILAECRAVDGEGNSAIGAAVEKQGKNALAAVFTNCQKQAIQQLVPQSDIKRAKGERVNGYEKPKRTDHYSRAFAAKKALDSQGKMNNGNFWKWLRSQTKGKVKGWTDLKADTKLCCRLAALLTFLRKCKSRKGPLFF